MNEGRNNLGGGTLTSGIPRAVGSTQLGVKPGRGQHTAIKPGGAEHVRPTLRKARVEQALAAKQQAEDPLAPLYERLPRGPHQMKPREVAENQRSRMHGAMVEAVAANGYGRTSVKQVVALAGVSRRAFYEQFANKQECFLATLDIISSRVLEEISGAYRSVDGGLEQSMQVALERLATIVRNNPKSARVLLIDAPSAGPSGWLRLTETFAALEALLATSFAHAPDTAPLPAPVVRGIVGGLRRMTLLRLREQRTDELPAMVNEMLKWVLVFKAATPLQLGSFTQSAVHGEAPSKALPGDDRTGLLHSALELAELEGYGNVTPLRIADEAGVSIDVFFELFADMEECFLAALDEVAEELRGTLVDPGLTSPEWANAVRRALSALTRRLATHPSYGHAIATGVFTMGERAVQLTAELARDIATTLIDGAPGPACSDLTQEGIEGAIWHTIYCQATRGRTDLLPQFSDDLAYVVLTPFLGAEEAIRVMSEDPVRV